LLRANFRLRMLEATHVADATPEDGQLNENARKCASGYNRVVIAETAK
jgi:hypothetical protein